jgi:hypothetical protein
MKPNRLSLNSSSGRRKRDAVLFGVSPSCGTGDDVDAGNARQRWRFHVGGEAVIGVDLSRESSGGCGTVKREGLPLLVSFALFETRIAGSVQCQYFERSHGSN